MFDVRFKVNATLTGSETSYDANVICYLLRRWLGGVSLKLRDWRLKGGKLWCVCLALLVSHKSNPCLMKAEKGEWMVSIPACPV